MPKAEPEKQKIRVKLRSYDPRIIDKSAQKIIETASRTGAKVIGPVPLPVEKTITTVLRSTNIDKDSREQFEMRVHKRLLDIVDPKQRTIDALMEIEMPAGVDIEVKM